LQKVPLRFPILVFYPSQKTNLMGTGTQYVHLTFRMFDINDLGDIILVDMTLLNGSTAHMVALATDSGIPPRQVRY
jgi:hypothetical protein